MGSLVGGQYKRTLRSSVTLRASLLKHDPEIHSIGMPTLVGIANAIEHESIRRYAQLAQTMDRLGEVETAAAFRTMLHEERAHLEGIERWAARLGVPVPSHEAFEWSLPADLSESWNDIAGSALLTPYRAFAIAVDNEQRAFSFYAYLAAHASDARVAGEAEELAAGELRHAARVRAWRRAAWHRERPLRAARAPELTTVAALHDFLAQCETSIRACHRAIAARLRELGDEQSATLLEQLAARPGVGVAQVAQEVGALRADAAHGADADADAAVGVAQVIAATRDPVHLLVAAQKPLEALSESLESVLRVAEGDLFAQAEKAATDVVSRLSRISLQTERRMQSTVR